MATESTGTASIDVPILDGSKAGLYDESEVQFEKGRVYSRERFSFFASEFEDTIHAPHLSGLVDKGQSFSELFDEANGTWWLDCMDPTDDEMRIISRAFGIHPLTIEDITTEESREKVELFTHYYFVCFHTFDQDKESEEFLEPVNMYFVVFRAGILSFHFSPVPHTASVRKRICQLRDYVAVSADWICYALIDDITDSFAPIIREIEEEADIVEDSVYVARDDDFVGLLRRIGESRRKVMTLMRLLSGKADVIKMFAKRCQKNWDNAPKGEIGLYLGDIQDHIFTMHQNLSVYERIFARSHGNYMAQLQVESIAGNNRVTKMLGKVTVLGTLFLPMNLITGLFGMNVTVPGEQQGNLKWWLGILFFIVGIGVIVFFVCNRFFLDDDAASRIGSSSSVSFKSSAISRLAGGSRRSQANPRLEIRD
jgi:magnesium transporter